MTARAKSEAELYGKSLYRSTDKREVSGDSLQRAALVKNLQEDWALNDRSRHLADTES